MIASIKSDLFFANMYPTISTPAGFVRPHLIKAALIQPLDHINIICGDFKKCVVACLASHYHLADLKEAEVKRQVKDLLKDHRYIFPVDKKVGGKLRHLLSPSILNSSPPSTIPKKPNERELPFPLLAIPATALYAGSIELCMTGSQQPTLFTEDAFEDICRNHVAVIELNRCDAPQATHKLLHGLFNQVMANRNTTNHTSGSAATLIQPLMFHLIEIPC
ncbi:hypothetical protein B0H14DRAFT_2646126 [Mycena olivaceomarginata]|nr:hypothetical protein B0H14DRAFT_2646126 [Mycena olivaceomarginata]